MPPTIHEVKAKYEKQLLARPGVVSVGVGRGPRGEPVLVVGLDAPPKATLEALPTQLDGYPVVTRVTGPLQAR